LFWNWRRARLTGRALRGLKLLGDDEAPDRQLIYLQPSNPRAADRQSTDGKCTEGCCAHCNCAQRKPAYSERPGCNRTKGSWGCASRRFQALHGVA
jgi:hypothetical protein